VTCGSSFSSSAVSSSAGSACTISSGRVTIATPSFGTYYLATASSNVVAPTAQAVTAAPVSPPSEDSSTKQTVSDG
jgi:hypothetical protein